MPELNFELSEKISPNAILSTLSSECGVNVNNLKFAEIMDDKDSLKDVRTRFHYPKKINFKEYRGDSGNDVNEECIYMCGNSLGLQPKITMKAVNKQFDQWAKLGVECHFSGPLPAASCDKYGRESLGKLIGANPETVALMNGLTVNLHLLLISFYQPTNDRFKILIEKGAFPSDRYAVRSQVKMRGYGENAVIEIGPRQGEHVLRNSDILRVIEEKGNEISVICLSGVQYYTGQKFDMGAITRVGQAKGCIVGWDLAHAVGNVELFLDGWNVDFACWCSYKYLNSGPGCMAGAYVNSRHKNRPAEHLHGWWGNQENSRFSMFDQMDLAQGIDGFKLSNPSPVLVSCVLSSLEIFDEVGMEALLKKQFLLTGFLEYLLKNLNDEVNGRLFEIITPSNPKERGCQLSLIFYFDLNQVHNILKKGGVVCDIRLPNVMRIAPVPLYNSYRDVYNFVRILRETLRKMLKEFC